MPNPEIDFDSCPMQMQTACEPFPDRPVVIGINSFGFGGANGHCVVREHRPAEPRSFSAPLAPEGGVTVPLSARTPAALSRSAGHLREALDEHDFDLYTLAGNLVRHRTHFAARTSFSVRSREELTAALEAFADDPGPSAGQGMISSESRMREIRTSGLMSGDWKRGHRPAPPGY